MKGDFEMLSSEIYGIDINEFSAELQKFVSHNPIINEIVTDAATEGIKIDFIKTEVEEITFISDPTSVPDIRIRNEIYFDKLPGIGIISDLPVLSLEEMKEMLITRIAKELCYYLDEIVN